MDNFINVKLLDTFRIKHPELEERYSWWSYRAGARARNVGWRIDYFWVSQIEKIAGAGIHNDVFGSDHCPVSIKL